MKSLNRSELAEFLLLRGPESSETLKSTVEQIITDVEKRGDEALLDSAKRFDSKELSSIHVSREELEEATVEAKLFESIRFALKRVQYFHLNQLEVILQGWWGSQLSLIPDILELKLPRKPIDVRWAISREPSRVAGFYPRSEKLGIGQRLLSLEKVGVYVPGGRAIYPSSVIMNAGPATVAQVPFVMVATPSRRDGLLHPAVLTAIREVGVNQTVKVGGAAAIAAMALGTESVPRVDKIVGPGNQFVNEAKRQLWGRCGFDGYAGPSEVAVLVDQYSNARFAALDLLTQIEHAPNNVAFLVSTSESKLLEIKNECESLFEFAQDPAGIRTAYSSSVSILVSDLDEAADVINEIAPEHLSISLENPQKILPRVQSAGCVLLGDGSAESAGDYLAGPSHTLPTGGAARWQSPVNIMEFLKFQSVIETNFEEISELSEHIDRLARIEGFPIHAMDATGRKQNIDHLSEVRGC
jgi:histidinol dehydrogenase